ncbi:MULTISPECIES: hypothetical protein [Kitasatospora]|uniref:Uncharacterized protein n=2 Tax=Kitasatospora TaxID=2063 RepID=A0ABT1J207_9ACTN|nr:hypothetical protein [Kitasatospora paracochleata]MCP2311452.1 hypothetical protein [Kitasatospora paracochleata]
MYAEPLRRWRVEIPHLDGHPAGSHVFIVEATGAEHALECAVARAESLEARRHRRDVVLDPTRARLAVIHPGVL